MKKNGKTKYRVVSTREDPGDEYGSWFTRVLCLQGMMHVSITYSSLMDFEDLPAGVADHAFFSPCDCKEHPKSSPKWLERQIVQHLRRERKRPLVNHTSP